MSLPLNSYRKAVRLDELFSPDRSVPLEQKDVGKVVDELLEVLGRERGGLPQIRGILDKRQALKSLLTVRGPEPMPEEFLNNMDRLLLYEIGQKNVTDAALLGSIADEMPGTGYRAADQCMLWQGDISNLKADAVVNAANENMLGCFAPFHDCIDNVIHSAAGPCLREDCHKIMQIQGHAEKTGDAKITRGYHLPARYVVHTVGPIYAASETPSRVSAKQIGQLADCYRSCLDLGAQIKAIQTLAFCSVSTGVFGFPPEIAARIALETVEMWLSVNPGRLRIIFNVYSDRDLVIYQDLLSGRFK